MVFLVWTRIRWRLCPRRMTQQSKTRWQRSKINCPSHDMTPARAAANSNSRLARGHSFIRTYIPELAYAAAGHATLRMDGQSI